MTLELDGRRKELCDWLTANGIDPADVPIDGDLTIVDSGTVRAIRVEVEVRGENGRVLRDEREDRAARELRTVPLLVEPPDWWEPYEKPTRAQLLAVMERIREIPRIPHSSQQEGVQGRAYTRGWQSVITCIDGAILGRPADPEAAEYPHLTTYIASPPEPEPDDQPVQCWHYEPDSPCDWDICRQPERLAAGDRGTDPARRGVAVGEEPGKATP